MRIDYDAEPETFLRKDGEAHSTIMTISSWLLYVKAVYAHLESTWSALCRRSYFDVRNVSPERHPPSCEINGSDTPMQISKYDCIVQLQKCPVVVTPGAVPQDSSQGHMPN